MKHIIYIAFCSILFCSCIVDPEDQEVINIDSEFEIALSQSLSKNGSTFAIFIETLFPQLCEDSYIISDLSHTQDHVRLDIQTILNNGNCTGDHFSAQKTESIELDNGEYNFEIVLRNSIHSFGVIQQTHDRYSLTMKDVNGVLITKTEVLKVPQGYYWGTVNSQLSNADPQSIIQEIKSTLQLESVDFNILPSGDYALFQIKEDTSVYITYPYILSQDPYISFIFRSDAALDSRQQSVYQLRENFPDANIQLMDSMGNVY